MVKTNDVTTDGTPILKQEYGLALGRVTNTKGSVWTYRMGHNRIVPRRVIKAVQMTDAWRNHLNDLAKRSPIDPAHFFEFKSTLAYGLSDLKIEERKVEEQIVERTQMPTPQPAPEPITPTTVVPASPGPAVAVPTQGNPAQEEQQVRFAPAAVAPPASPMPRRRMDFGSPLPAIIAAAAQPDPQRPRQGCSTDCGG